MKKWNEAKLEVLELTKTECWFFDPKKIPCYIPIYCPSNKNPDTPMDEIPAVEQFS